MDDNTYAERNGLCPQCKGRGFVLYDVNYGHPDFAKLIPCNRCSDGSRPEASPLKDLEVPEDVREATFARVVRHPEIVRALDVAELLVRQRHGFMTLWGPPGVGKSEVMGCIRNAARSEGVPCLYADAIRLFGELRKRLDADAGPGYDETWERVLNVSVLLIDDLHAVSKTGWVWERVSELICSRYDHRRDRLTCMATNEDIDCFPDFLRSRIRDRQCYLIEVTGSDARQRKR